MPPIVERRSKNRPDIRRTAFRSLPFFYLVLVTIYRNLFGRAFGFPGIMVGKNKGGESHLRGVRESYRKCISLVNLNPL